MSELRYYRSVNSLAIWEKGKDQKGIPSLEDASRYLRDIKEGKGFPSFWLSSCPEDLEKIALGILLKKRKDKSPDSVNLVGFDECCFSNIEVEINNVEDVSFPIPSVGHLHYEMCTLDDNKLIAAIEIFMKCNGGFINFVRADRDKNNMRKIAAKYIDEVSEQYKETVHKWGQEYLS